MQPAKQVLKYLLALLLLYVVLVIHVFILYAFLPTHTILYQALLRWLVAISPLAVTFLVLRSRSYVRYLMLLVWLFFIPYPYYNFYQLRHIAEIVKVPGGSAFTDSAVIGSLWMIIPVCIYSISQLWVFFYCLYKVCRNTLQQLTVILYVSVAVVLGLSSRLDTFHLVLKPAAVIGGFQYMLARNGMVNIVSVFIAGIMLFYLWRWLKSSNVEE